MNAHDIPEVGVEEEFLLLDASTGGLLPCGTDMVAQAHAADVDAVSELTRCQVETNSPPFSDMRALRRHVIDTRTRLGSVASANGAKILATGVCPIPTSSGMRGPAAVSDTERYGRLAQEYGALTFADPCCGTHVHVEIPNRAVALAVSNHIRPWLPTLVALTANSAIHEGNDTRHASWRSVLWGRWPTAGPPPLLDSEAHYDDIVGTLIAAGTILDEGALYWDLRPSSHHPTIELRVSDVPAAADETALLATLTRALVLTAQWSDERGETPPRPAAHHLTAAYDCARRHGLDGVGVDPISGRPVWSREMVSRLVRYVRAALVHTDDLNFVESALQHLDHLGNGARRQRDAFTAGGVPEVVNRALRATAADWSVVDTSRVRASVDAAHGSVH